MTTHQVTRPARSNAGGRGSTARSILDAATHLFATRGVSATSVDDVAAAAGTAKGSVYYNFSSKAGLVEALINEHADRVSASVRKAGAGLSGPALRRAVISTVLQEMEDHPDAVRVLASEVFRTDRSWKESVSTWRNAIVEPLIPADSPDSDIHTDRIAAAAIAGATLTAGMEWLVYRPDLTLDDVRAQVYTALNLN